MAKATVTIEQAIKAADAAEAAMIAVWYRPANGGPLHCHQFPHGLANQKNFFQLDDLDLAVGLLASAVNQVKDDRAKAAPPELPQPPRPAIFRTPIRRDEPSEDDELGDDNG